MNKDTKQVDNNDKALHLADIVRSWIFKRILLNIAWILINLFGLVLGAIYFSGIEAEFLLLWYLFVMIYGYSSRVIASIIFDALIGDC